MRCVFASIVMLGLAGCGVSGHEASTHGNEESVDVGKDHLSAVGALASTVQDLDMLQQELATVPRAETVHFSVLIDALPEAPDGWTADKPHGLTNQMGDYRLSEASRKYRRKGGPERVEIQIQDWAFNQVLYIPFFMQARFGQESTEGYSKGIKVGKSPGREEYTIASRSGQRSVLVNKRFQVQIRIDDMEPEAFEEWWPRVKIDELTTERL